MSHREAEKEARALEAYHSGRIYMQDGPRRSAHLAERIDEEVRKFTVYNFGSEDLERAIWMMDNASFFRLAGDLTPPSNRVLLCDELGVR